MRSLDIVDWSDTGHRQSSSKPSGAYGFTPRAGLRVQIEGRSEVFIVLRVDKARHLTDLLRLGRVRKVESGIPAALLRVVAPEQMNDSQQNERVG